MSCNTGNYRTMPMSGGMPYAIDRMPIAMAYVPWQHFARTYELDRALTVGTIFPELDKPFTGKGGNC
ncbi:MAG: spore coat associated protein CotJA [Lachnospiraceae bacterium]|nr:spore coat associated protein CotJA [Lachnospiraceae bacterium]